MNERRYHKSQIKDRQAVIATNSGTKRQQLWGPLPAELVHSVIVHIHMQKKSRCADIEMEIKQKKNIKKQ